MPKTAKSTAAATTEAAPASARLAVRKTYKLFVGGAFPRSESGRTYQVNDASGALLANAALASRKDARDAVSAARKAFGPWSARTGYNRGQILYRIAEMLEGRRDQFTAELTSALGLSKQKATAEVDAAIDRWIWYAGWADKYAQVAGSANPVSGPYFDFSTPEPTGVVVALAPERPALLAIASLVAPAVTVGSTVVLVVPGAAALPAITLAEVLVTSDLPGGVINILTGDTAELAPHLAGHRDVNALDLAGAAPAAAVDHERTAADTLKRVLRRDPAADWRATPTLDRLAAFTETKTVWHPNGI